MNIDDVPEGMCQEASILSREKYIPCGQPATRLIRQSDGMVLRMCGLCADHNIRNRGAVEEVST